MESEDEQISEIGESQVHFSSLDDIKVYESSGSGTSNELKSGKYYKQSYRTAWEQMPDFKGWLRGIPGEPNRAFCMFCQKSLHAHRLSLLKHTCTIRHQKAAQLNYLRQNKDTSVGEMESVHYVEAAGGSSGAAGGADPEGDDVSYESLVEADYSHDQHDNDHDNDNDDEDNEDESVDMDDLPAQLQKQVRESTTNTMSSTKPVISTHVLDTSVGGAVPGLQVSLYKLVEGRWTYMNEGVTSRDGRLSTLVSRQDFTAGRYKLHFDVDRYFQQRRQDSLYPFVEIVFDCKSPQDHYHIPLLLGPFGYTTYRGT